MQQCLFGLLASFFVCFSAISTTLTAQEASTLAKDFAAGRPVDWLHGPQYAGAAGLVALVFLPLAALVALSMCESKPHTA
jgi:hypothetical protein